MIDVLLYFGVNCKDKYEHFWKFTRMPCAPTKDMVIYLDPCEGADVFLDDTRVNCVAWWEAFNEFIVVELVEDRCAEWTAEEFAAVVAQAGWSKGETYITSLRQKTAARRIARATEIQ